MFFRNLLDEVEGETGLLVFPKSGIYMYSAYIYMHIHKCVECDSDHLHVLL